jgi:capsular polysaccharide biosynthesis protein
LLSILAAVMIFSIFPPNLINILLGIILGLLTSVAIYAKEKYDEF